MKIFKDMIRALLILTGSMLFLASCSSTAPATNQTPAAAATPLAEGNAFASAQDALAAGNQLMDSNQTEQAIEAYRKAIEMDPDLGEAYFQLGIAYALVENEQRGKPGDGSASPVLPGEKTDKRKSESDKMFEKAVEAYKKQLSHDPDNDAAQFNLGRSLNKLNLDEDAEKAFQKAVKLKPENSEYQTELGAILIKLARYREAIAPLKKAVELDPDNTEAQELLDDAEAGRQRIDYSSPKKDDKKGEKPANKESNANSVSGSNSNKTQEGPMPITRETKKPDALSNKTIKPQR
jgi:tetratricopeptide (TPR) repeat protein